MKLHDIIPNDPLLEDLSRRGFLKGVGAAAAAGATGGAMAQSTGNSWRGEYLVPGTLEKNVKYIITDVKQQGSIFLVKTKRIGPSGESTTIRSIDCNKEMWKYIEDDGVKVTNSQWAGFTRGSSAHSIFKAVCSGSYNRQGVAEGWSGIGYGGMAGGILGAGLGAIGALFAPWGSKMATFQGITSLSAALGAWMAHKHDDDIKKYNEQTIFDVYINGKKLTNNQVNKTDASDLIAKSAEKAHDPNTFYTIFDNRQNKIVWRFKISDEQGEDDTVAEKQGVVNSVK